MLAGHDRYRRTGLLAPAEDRVDEGVRDAKAHAHASALLDRLAEAATEEATHATALLLHGGGGLRSVRLPARIAVAEVARPNLELW